MERFALAGQSRRFVAYCSRTWKTEPILPVTRPCGVWLRRLPHVSKVQARLHVLSPDKVARPTRAYDSRNGATTGPGPLTCSSRRFGRRSATAALQCLRDSIEI
jgi:hypothetical protein